MGGYKESSGGSPGSGGTKRQAKNYQKKNKPNIIKTVVQGSMVGRVLTSLSKGLEKRDLERRKEFITRQNKKLPPGERLDFTDKYLATDEGRDELRSKYGYRTALDINSEGNNNVASTKSKIQKDSVKKAPDGPTVAELVQKKVLTEEERLLEIKRKGRRVTKLKTDEDEPTLSKKILLG